MHWHRPTGKRQAQTKGWQGAANRDMKADMTDPIPSPATHAKIAFIGLGTMGGAMARHLGNAGHALTIFNRTPSRAEAWQATNPGITVGFASSPADAAENADVVITCVGNDDDLADVVLSPNGVFSTLRRGALYIDHTTVSARIARQIAVEGRDKELLCVDAPVTGGQSGAESGTLAIMCGGSAKAVDAARPILSAYAKRVVHVGKSGAGQTAKMANQMCIAGAIAGLSEAIRFAELAHLDLDKVSRRFPAVQRNHGKWTTASTPWPRTSSTSALRLI
jgi:3-hydroxyisobutyrate dehydrogenase